MAEEATSRRLLMVEHQLRRRGILDPRVLAAFERTPRELFVSQHLREAAYEDRPLDIGDGQTISQPYMVAAMLDAADIAPDHVVLEVGTGSGYQTALLAELAAEVFSMERIPRLAEVAQSVLRDLQFANVVVSVGDGGLGLPCAAPFDRIIVSAAAPEIPPALTDQLRDGGKLVIPVGPEHEQLLLVVTRARDGLHEKRLWACRFVPLLGESGFRRAG